MQPQTTVHSPNVHAPPHTESIGSLIRVTLSLPRGKVPIELGEGDEVVLGRQQGANYKLVDLTAYHAIDYGVSRTHALLRYKNNRLWVEDLDTTNGTWLNDIRLAPHVPYHMENNSELMLAGLSIKILITREYTAN